MNLTDFTDTGEQDEESLRLGLLGAMEDGFVEQFEAEPGLFVKRSEDSIYVHDGSRELGGRLLLTSGWTLREMNEWLEMKLEAYK